MTGDVVTEGEEVGEGKEEEGEGEREEVGGRESGDVGDGMFDSRTSGEGGRSGDTSHRETRQGTSGDAHFCNETVLYWQIEDCQSSDILHHGLLSLPPSLPLDPSSREGGTNSGPIRTPLPIPPSLTDADTTSTTGSSVDESNPPLSAGKHVVHHTCTYAL